MTAIADKDYIVIVQCHQVKERCAGYHCERALHQRTGGFAGYPADKAYRYLAITCGGCPGGATQRKLANLLAKSAKREGLTRAQIVVHLSSCITRDNHHGPPCPHIAQIIAVIARLGLDCREDTNISLQAEERRQAGIYQARAKHHHHRA